MSETARAAVPLAVGALLEAYAERALSPVEVLADIAPRLEREGARLNALRAQCLERAQAEAVQAERLYASGAPVRPLEGVPFASKDLFDTAGVVTSYGSPMFDSHVPARDAEAVARMRAAGAILVAKTTTDEFAHGITGTNTHCGPVRNPWAPDRISGGSSAGSGAAVAAGIVPIALGSDTGGSIRVPAALCGVVGFKPTFGMVPTDGLFPMAPSLDHAGVLTTTPHDAARVLDVLGEKSATDSFDGPGAVELPLRVGVSGDLMPPPLTPEMARAVAVAGSALAGTKGAIVEVPVPGAERILPIFQVTQRAEAAATHRRHGLFPARAEAYGPRVRARLELGAALALDDYLDAQLERDALRRSFLRVFDKVDVLVTPVTASTAPVIAADIEDVLRDRVMPFTTPHDLFGLPSCTVRTGFDEAGLPVAVQVAGAPGRDALVLCAAAQLYAALPEIQSQRPQPRPATAEIA